MLIPGVWMDLTETDANVAWVRETHDALRLYFRDGRWLNYFDDDEPSDAIRSIRAELRPPRRGEAGVRPCERLPPEPQHSTAGDRLPPAWPASEQRPSLGRGAILRAAGSSRPMTRLEARETLRGSAPRSLPIEPSQLDGRT